MDIDLADNIWIIFAAYVAAFLPWTLISSSFDFISPVWKTVRDTWIEGWLVILYSTIPVVYILFYIVVQGEAEDFKEMFAAIVALLFSLLYILRAIWGLWKLRCFRNWAARSIMNLRKLGIEYKNDRTDKESGTTRDAFSVADGLFVNDSIIDNQLSNGSCPCLIRYGSKVFQISSNSQHGFLRRFFVLPARLLFPVRLFLYILKDVVTGKFKFKIDLMPERPVEVWLNWAVIFASQGLKEWINEFRVAHDPDEDVHDVRSNSEMFKERQRYFAGEVLASAALHFWPGRSECNVRSPMMWSMWKEESDIVDGKLSKRELLRDAIESGKGLPFNARHDAPGGLRETQPEGYVDSYEYGRFSRQLRRIVDSVPSGFGEWIEKFDKEKLEWLAIMLCLGAHASEEEGESDSYKRGKEKCVDGSEDDRDTRESEVRDEKNETVEELNCKDVAVENLVEQLGLDEDYTRGRKDSNIRRLCAFPLPESCLNNVAKCNRLVMRVGEMIDIWSALEAGRQMIYLKGFGESWDIYCRGYNDRNEDGGFDDKEDGKNVKRDKSDGLEEISKDDDEIKGLKERERLLEAQKEVERARFQFQLAEMNQRYWHMEQTIRFVGYGMEFVRTELASWKERNEGIDEEVWKGRFGRERENGIYVSELVNVGRIRDDVIIRGLRKKGVGYLERRSVQSRIIWETQRGLERAYKNNKVGPKSVELMMMCVLCFPSISVRIGEERSLDMGSVVERRNECVIMFKELWGCVEKEMDKELWYEIVISAECGPQEVEVVVNGRVCGDDEGLVLSASLRGRFENGEGQFMWEWWRDCFTARIESMSRWEKEHEFGRGCEVRKTEGSISKGIEKGRRDVTLCRKPYYSWKGWLPFRTEICRYELESREFLWEYKSRDRSHWLRDGGAGSKSTSTGMTLSERRRCRVSYDDVGREQLRHFNFVVREVGFTGREGDEEANGNEDAEIMARAVKLFEKGPEHFSRGIFLLETAVTENRDTRALEECIDKLVAEGESQDIGRALGIVENYVSVVLPLSVNWGRSDVFSFVEEENNVMRRMKKLLMVIVQKDGYSPRSTKVMSIFVTAMCATRMEEIYEGFRIMETLIFKSRELNLLNRYLELVKSEDFKWKRKENFGRIIPNLSRNLNVGSATKDGGALYDFVKECYWRVALEGGNTGAKNSLGVHLKRGADCISGDAIRAKELYEEAIKQDRNVPSMYNLANLLENGAEGVQKNAIRAKELYEEAIKQDRDVSSMNNLAILLENGAEGVQKDAIRAKELYEEAINQDRHVSSMNNLGLLLQNGAEGVEKDAIRAKELYEEAIKQDRNVPSMYNLANLLEDGAEGVQKNAIRAKELYEEAINQDRHVPSMYSLANLLKDGAEGVQKDAIRAKELYEEAINQDRNVPSMYNLANLLENGAEGVEKDAIRAKELYEEAIKQDRHVSSMCNLANLLEDGAEGVQKDAIRAKELYEEAINQDCTPAMYNLAMLLESGTETIEKDAVRAKELYENAIEKGSDADAMENLAFLLEHGAEGVAKDEERAKDLRLQAEQERSRS